eukprot:TRINITY_DN5818_c0_g1_i1.p1 TRINITY_DN5818_c0_g1~~TRINITY_DN5818_c0_g1_i1.p1  ORF type:complete len:620 (-),score=107.74 TRINITY_DN5818_c0_g1_i1:47-1681(-)
MKAVGAGDVATNVLSGFTFILGFLVVFRSSQAYSRWWEGGTLLQQLRGEWFNSYSCLLAFCSIVPEKQEDVAKFQHQLVRLYSLLFGCALQQVATEEKKFSLIDIEGLEEESLMFLEGVPDRCEVVLQWIQRLILESETTGTIKVAPPILSRVFNELGNGIVNLNNARKITEFPIPFPLAQMITVMLLFHAFVTAIICVFSVETTFWAGFISFVVTCAYWSINYIAVELEMPYGGDLNDLPLIDMQLDMNRSLKTLVSLRAQRVPGFLYDAERHSKLEEKVVDFDGDLLYFKDKKSVDCCSDQAGEEKATGAQAIAVEAAELAAKPEALVTMEEKLQSDVQPPHQAVQAKCQKETKQVAETKYQQVGSHEIYNEKTVLLSEREPLRASPELNDCDQDAPNEQLCSLRMCSSHPVCQASASSASLASSTNDKIDRAQSRGQTHLDDLSKDVSYMNVNGSDSVDRVQLKAPKTMVIREQDEELVSLTTRMEEHLRQIANELQAISLKAVGQDPFQIAAVSRPLSDIARPSHVATPFLSSLFGKCTQ